jgi:16S rRNA (adenine1518-N6/adenine1519-N6)-dimethyltransferase
MLARGLGNPDMQTLHQIRSLLSQAGLSPRRRLGQCFLTDLNLMRKLLELAEIDSRATVLEVGPGTGSLTEELLARAGKVVAVEIDRGLCQLLRDRFKGRDKLALLCCDALARKHRLAEEVVGALGPSAELVSNLPFNIATPLLAECLVSSWRALHGQGGCRFDRLTFTVQKEVAGRLAAKPGNSDYGRASVLAPLLGQLRLGSVVPASAFWPRPKVASRMVRIDFDPTSARRVRDVERLSGLLAVAFSQRRKQIGSIVRRKQGHFEPEALDAALGAAGVDRSLRPQDVEPEKYLCMANSLAASSGAMKVKREV